MADQMCGVCFKRGEPGCECPSCDKPECPFAERDMRRREMFARFAVDATKPGPLAGSAVPCGVEPCPLGAGKPEPTCTNRHQCWEPCGELGKSEEHAVRASPELEKRINDAIGVPEPQNDSPKGP